MAPGDIPPRRVLVIAYYFPPMGLSGVQRTLKFVKYLPQFGWHPTVLTVEPRAYVARDQTLLEELPPEVRIIRTGAAGPAKVLSRKEVTALPRERVRKILSRLSDTVYLPDNKIGWKRRAVAKALELHQETPFDVIFATAPPFTSFLIGRTLKQHIGRPLVFDYRDPWVDYPFKFYPTPLHKKANILLERSALRASSHVVTTGRRVMELLLGRYGFLSHHDVDIISQGYDPADFAPSSNEVAPGAKPAAKGGRMRVTYAGILWEDRVPDYFLRALHLVFKESPRLRGRIEARFVGTFRPEYYKMIARLGLQDAVTVRDYLPHRECVSELLASDVLWMILGDDLGTPGKVYEYIGARKPILGCVVPGFMRATIQEAGGTVVDPEDVEGIKAALLRYFEQFERHQLSAPPEHVVAKYNRVNLTRELVRIFESLIDPL
jgi:glycosyltransferase involved in cell wall biosynthesis